MGCVEEEQAKVQQHFCEPIEVNDILFLKKKIETKMKWGYLKKMKK